jgi:hypothetical protein
MMRRAALLTLMCLSTLLAAYDVVLDGMTDGNFRYKDIGGQPYALSFANTYSYTTAHVVISFDTPGVNWLEGKVTATGLKPNFAYQIKLVGNPSKGSGSGLTYDDATNEIIGYMGRWWRIRPNPANSNDTDYNSHKDDPTYAFEGYVLIAFFITDDRGNADVRFAGRNSFHVLWRTDQRQAAANDGPPVAWTVPATAGNSFYDTSVAARNYELYGEWEPTRALPGTLEMPQWRYVARVFLTEESFHDSGTYAGQWAVAMAAPVEFDLPLSAGPEPPPSGTVLPLSVTRLRADLLLNRVGRDRAWVEGSLELPVGVTPAGAIVQAGLLGETRQFTLHRWGNDVMPGGSVVLRPPRAGSRTSAFRLRVTQAAFDAPASADGQNVPVIVSLKVGSAEYAAEVPARRSTSRSRQTLTAPAGN